MPQQQKVCHAHRTLEERMEERFDSVITKMDAMHEDIGYLKGRIDTNKDWWTRFLSVAAMFLAWLK